MSTIANYLSDLVAFKTVAGNNGELRRAIDYVDNFLSLRGMYTERFESNGLPSVVASTRRDNHRRPKVMLAAHIDVVPGPDAMFTMTRQGDQLHGRGVFDMKFAIATYMKLVDELQNNLGDYDFGIMITPDEESGGQNGTEFLIDQGFKPELVFLPDAGDTPDGWKLELSAKGTYIAKVTAYGRTTHGSRPWNGDNAIYKLIDLLAEIRAIFKDQSVDTDSLTVGMIGGGEARNQVPAEAYATLDIRTVTDERQKEIKQQLQVLCDKYGADLEELFPYGNAHITDMEHPLVRKLLEIIKKLVPAGVAHSHSTGASDARHLAKADITCVVASPPGNGYHDPVEWVSETGLTELLAVLRKFLDEVASGRS